MELTKECEYQLEQFGVFGDYLKDRLQLYVDEGKETYFESSELKRLWYLLKVEALGTYLMTQQGHYDEKAKNKLKVLLNYGSMIIVSDKYRPKLDNVLQDTLKGC